MTAPDGLVGFDATPLASGHAIRGIGRYVESLLTALAEARPDWLAERVGLLVVPGQTPDRGRPRWRTLRSPVRPADTDWLAAIVADRLATRRPRPEAWHQTDPSTPSSPLPRTRTAMTAYDLIPLHDADVRARIRPHRWLVYRKYLADLRRAATIVAISRATAADLVATLGIPPERIRTVYPHVRPPASAPAPGAIRPTFLFVGVPDPHKRPLLALAAFAAFVARHADGELVYVGHHPAGPRRAIERAAADSGVADRVRFLDRIADPELHRLYASGVVLAVSRIEGFGLPPVEAILAGGRAVTTPHPVYREVLGGAANEAATSEADAVAVAMARALDVAPSADDRAAIAERFGARAVADALIGVYDELLAR